MDIDQQNTIMCLRALELNTHVILISYDCNNNIYIDIDIMYIYIERERERFLYNYAYDLNLIGSANIAQTDAELLL